jgi:hypothetical protein
MGRSLARAFATASFPRAGRKNPIIFVIAI